MRRVLALLVVVTHFGAASTPCLEADFESMPLAEAGVRASHHAPTAPAPAIPATEEHAHHAAHPPSSNGHGDHGDHGDHGASHHGESASVSAAEADAQAHVLLHQLRATCMCGCSPTSQTPGTTTSPRLGFALLPADPPSLVETDIDPGVRAVSRPPAPAADPLEHVPIFS